MITYGRVHLLQEALYSFLNLEDNDSELIIVNDYPLQNLIFDHPQVKIYNLDKTFETIGEKENYAIEKCSGDLIAVFDDDDIALPNHLNNIKKFWLDDEVNLLHWQKAVYYNEPNITAITSVGNSGIVYSKKAWERIGKSPLENAGGDMTLVVAIRKLDLNGIVLASPDDKNVSWFYRWATPFNYHQSGMGTDDGTRPNIVMRNAEYVESLRIQGIIPVGNVKLKPKWNHDYSKMLKDYVNGKTS